MVEEEKKPAASPEDKQAGPPQSKGLGGEEKKEEVKEEVKTEESKEESKEEKKPEEKEEEKTEMKKEEPKPPAAKAPEDKVADKVEDKPSVAEAAEAKEVKVPTKFKKLVDEIEKMNIMDLAELVKILEKKFGVSPVISASTAVGAGAPVPGEEAEKEEKSEFNIELKSAGEQKIQVIKLVREITGKGLKESKDIVDAAPKVIKGMQ